MEVKSACHFCFRVFSRTDGFDKRNVIANSRQQSAIIKQLRASLKKKGMLSKRDKPQTSALPIDVQKRTSTRCYRPFSFCWNKVGLAYDAATEQTSQRDSERSVNASPGPKRRNSNESQRLKAALTHPALLKFLRSFMIAQSNDNTLDFYLDIVEIRSLVRERYCREAHELYMKLARTYVLDGSPRYLPTSDSFKEMTAERIRLPFGGKLDKLLLEGLISAQRAAFISIKVDSWSPFCKSDIITSIMKDTQGQGVPLHFTPTLIRSREMSYSNICLSRSDSYASVYQADVSTGTCTHDHNETPGTVLRGSLNSSFTPRQRTMSAITRARACGILFTPTTVSATSTATTSAASTTRTITTTTASTTANVAPTPAPSNTTSAPTSSSSTHPPSGRVSTSNSGSASGSTSASGSHSVSVAPLSIAQPVSQRTGVCSQRTACTAVTASNDGTNSSSPVLTKSQYSDLSTSLRIRVNACHIFQYGRKTLRKIRLKSSNLILSRSARIESEKDEIENNIENTHGETSPRRRDFQ